MYITGESTLVTAWHMPLVTSLHKLILIAKGGGGYSGLQLHLGLCLDFSCC